MSSPNDHSLDTIPWDGPSRYGRAGVAARRLLRRLLRPLLVREAEAYRRMAAGLNAATEDARLAHLVADPVSVGEVLVVETDVGDLALHAHDEVITPIIQATGRWEEAEAAWLRAILSRGQTVVDCGANVGYFTVMASSLVGPSGRVVAVEPEAANLRLLRHNLWRNRCDNVRVIPAAAGDGRGVVALRRHSSNTGDHQVHPQGGAGDVLVPAIALDEILGDAVIDVLKVDVQGFDHLVVAGARRVLERSPAAQVLVEVWLDTLEERGVDVDAVLAEYRSLGRPMGMLTASGVVVDASDDEIKTAAAATQPYRWVNVILGPKGSADQPT